MKLKGILCLLLALAIRCEAQQNQDVFISGKILNLNNRTTVIDLSEVGALRPENKDREIITDSSGNFSIHFKLSAANYFSIVHNTLYLSPGEQLKVRIDFNDLNKSTFFGKGSIADEYLKSIPFPKEGSYLEGGTKLKGTIKETVDLVLALAQQRREKLKGLRGVTPGFIKLEEGRIDADIINSFKWLPGIFTRQNKIARKDQDPYFKEAFALTQPYGKLYAKHLHHADFLKIEVVRDNFYRIMDSLSDSDPNTARIKDWQYAYETVYYINEAKDKTELLKFKGRIDSINNPAYRSAVRESFDLKAGFWEGDDAIDFKAYDSNNKTVALSSFKGKIIYIDLWATWCVPCLKELPYLDSLRNRYASDPNVVFVSLSLNEHSSDWKQSIQRRQAEGIQLITNHEQIMPYKIYAIPRAIIIDKNFKVLMMNAPMPSNPNLKGYLDALLKRQSVN